MPPLDDLFLALIIGYLFGSIPVAALVSRYRRVDIFATGTRLAGAANVWRNVGRREGVIVFAGDVAKGTLAIMVAQRFGLQQAQLLLPVLMVLMGHWNSVLTRFRGGDGVAVGLGMTVAMVPFYGLIASVFGLTVAFIAKGTGHQPTIWGGLACYGLLLSRALLFQQHMPESLSLVVMALLVLGHGVVSHWRHRAAPN
ncbi:MAG: glycerol-3-phosphate acyltransferase [Chloroflexi bacterium]|nr:glycerol-3-phosphate acyltransferase [Chloroflexota bacterium]